MARQLAAKRTQKITEARRRARRALRVFMRDGVIARLSVSHEAVSREGAVVLLARD
jgi:hypothetical protein